MTILKKKLIYFVGRKDSQIKHMGYRLELNELEVVISKIPLVNEVYVFYLKKENSDFGKIKEALLKLLDIWLNL